MTSITSRGPSLASSITVLEMGTETSTVRLGVDVPASLYRDVSLGVDSLVGDSLRHVPPRPIELEHAIELTEEAVMPLANQFTGANHLVLQGMGAALIAHSLDAGDMAPTMLTLDEVESLFNRLVAVSEGRPTSQEALPTDARFFAAMLILREFMHHLKFINVTLQPPRDPE